MSCFTKWYILIVTSYASGLQGLLWMSYSIIPAVSKTFLQIGDGSSGDSVLLWLLNAGPIAYILTVTCASATLDAANGLRSAVLWGSGMCLVAAVMRCIPLLFTQAWSPFKVDAAAQGEGGWPQYLLVPVFIAQIINAAAAPFTQASPSLLSQTWFGVNERRTATAVARVSNAGGRAIGFLIGPLLIHTASDMPLFLAIHIVLAAIPMVAAVLYFPGAPALAPSASAKLYGARGAEHEAHDDVSALLAGTAVEGGEAVGDGGALRDYASADALRADALRADALRADALDADAGSSEALGRQRGSASGGAHKSRRGAVVGAADAMRRVLSGAARVFFSKRRFGFLVIAFGLQMGGYGAWSGALTSVLTVDGVAASKASWLGFGNTIAGMVGGTVAGFLTDCPALAKRLRLVMVVLALAAAAAFLAPALALKPTQLFTMPYPAHVVLCAFMSFMYRYISRESCSQFDSLPLTSLTISGTLSGLFRGALDPLFFEMSTELAFVENVPAGTAGGALTVWCHAVMIIFLTTGIFFPGTLNNVMLLGMVGCMVLSALLTGLTKQDYRRTEMDLAAAGVVSPGARRPAWRPAYDADMYVAAGDPEEE
jgi:MFS family permease